MPQGRYIPVGLNRWVPASQYSAAKDSYSDAPSSACFLRGNSRGAMSSGEQSPKPPRGRPFQPYVDGQWVWISPEARIDREQYEQDLREAGANNGLTTYDGSETGLDCGNSVSNHHTCYSSGFQAASGGSTGGYSCGTSGYTANSPSQQPYSESSRYTVGQSPTDGMESSIAGSGRFSGASYGPTAQTTGSQTGFSPTNMGPSRASDPAGWSKSVRGTLQTFCDQQAGGSSNGSFGGSWCRPQDQSAFSFAGPSVITAA